MECVRNRMKMELVSCERRFQKLVNKSTFKCMTSYNEDLSAVSMANTIIKFDKPIYIGKYLHFKFSIDTFIFLFYFYIPRFFSVGN